MTLRQRTTWSNPRQAAVNSQQAATKRRADIYTMNQEHPQPSAVEYENGSPEAWAETPVSGAKMLVEDEYDGDHVKRNELNFAEFRDDTWKHKDADQWNGKGKYDNARVSAEKKAALSERIARSVLRTDNEQLIEDTALDFMALPMKSLMATIRRINAASPDALSGERRYKRAVACAKLASRILSRDAGDENIAKLGSIFMGLDDPTLKAILSTVAAFRVAEEQEQQEEEGAHTSQEQQEEEEQSSDHTGQEEQQSQEQQAQEEQQAQQQQEADGLCPEDNALLQQILQEEQAEHCQPEDDLQAMFQAPPAGPAPMVVPVAPVMASNFPEISFDDDAGDVTADNSAVASLDSIFADDPEVVAQREILAANRDQAMRENGSYSVGNGRTASTKGVKKLGAVQGSKSNPVDQELQALWERT